MSDTAALTSTERAIEALKLKLACLEDKAAAEALRNTTSRWEGDSLIIRNARGAVVVKSKQIDASTVSFIANESPPLRLRVEMERSHPLYEHHVQALAAALLTCVQAGAGSTSPTPSLPQKLRTWAAQYGGARPAALRYGFPERTLSGWLRGERLPTIAYAARIAAATGISLAEVEAGCSRKLIKVGAARNKPEGASQG